MDILIKAVENIVGLRIDRYIAFNYSDFDRILNLTQTSFTSIDSKKLNDKLINKSEVLSGNFLSRYLLDNSTFDDKILNRYVSFLISYLGKYKNIFFQYNSFLKSSDLMRYVSTDMTKSELLKYISSISLVNSDYKYGYIKQPVSKSVISIQPQEIINISKDINSSSSSSTSLIIQNKGTNNNESSSNDSTSSIVSSSSSISSAFTNNSKQNNLQENQPPEEFHLNELEADEEISKVFNNNEISKEQAIYAIENGEFDKTVIASTSQVVVVMTQDWCPQWTDLESWVYGIETEEDIDIYELEYNRVDYFNDFKNFKENHWKNYNVPYLRFYKDGALIKETNYIGRQQFKVIIGSGN